jgi:peptidoglycan/xylan/chitin deacetylase (PgdA/CDA1 family)
MRLPPQPLVLTFDDGFADVAEAAPMLAARGFRSTLYVTTGALRGRGPWHERADIALPPARMLDWSQLAELAAQHVEIGAHTHTHPQLDVLRPPRARDEIRLSKRLLEDVLRQEVSSFAYPHGFQSAATRQLVREAGYTSACAVGNALSSHADRVFSLSRLTVQADTTDDEVATWLAGRGAPVAPYPERLRTRAWRAYRKARGERGSKRLIYPTGRPYGCSGPAAPRRQS